MIKFSLTAVGICVGFLNSCQTHDAFQNSLVLGQNNIASREPYYTWHLQCLDKLSGKMQTTIKTSQNQSFLLSGEWSNNFEVFNGHVSNQLAQKVTDFKLTNRDFIFTTDANFNNLNATEAIQKTLAPFLKLGATSFRKTACGIIGFSQTGTKTLVIKPALPNQNLFSTALQALDGEFDLLALYDIQAKTTLANFHFKSQNQDDKLDMEWNGVVKPPRPETLKVTQNKSTTILTFVDFE